MFVVRELIWKPWILAHIAAHNVTQDEVEEACHDAPITYAGKERRTVAVGLTNAGRMVAAVVAPVFDPEVGPDVYTPVTARSASRPERRWYRAQQEATREE